MTLSKYTYPNRCLSCGKPTYDEPFCCRRCALEQQRHSFGATCRELRENPAMPIRGAATPDAQRRLDSFRALSGKGR